MTLDYVAGLFDGEGWFNITKAEKKECRYPAYQLHAAIVLRQQPVLAELLKLFAGTLTLAMKPTDRHAACYKWRVTGEGVAYFAAMLQHRLFIKGPQAALAIRFQAFKRQNFNRPNSSDRVEQLEQFYQEMKALNKKGPR